MAEEKKGVFCRDCGANVVAYRKGTNHVLHLLLSLFTLGIWLPAWILTSIKVGGWACGDCGSKKLAARKRSVPKTGNL